MRLLAAPLFLVVAACDEQPQQVASMDYSGMTCSQLKLDYQLTASRLSDLQPVSRSEQRPNLELVTQSQPVYANPVGAMSQGYAAGYAAQQQRLSLERSRQVAELQNKLATLQNELVARDCAF